MNSTLRLLRTATIAGLAALLAAALPPAARAAEKYPARAVRVIIPFPPGDTIDIIARLIGPKFTERTGQPFVVDNRPGGGGTIGLALLKSAAPDGYTIAIGQGGNMVVAPHTKLQVPYDPTKDFAPVALLATNYFAIVANKDAPFKTAPELIAWAKANPGKLLVASNGEGGQPHLSDELLARMAGFKFQHIPYKGTSQVVTALIAGEVQVTQLAFTTLWPHVEGGRLKLIAVTNGTRLADHPELPLMSETVPGYSAGGWFGFVAPAGTPPEIVARLNEEINLAMRQPDVAPKLPGLILRTESPATFGEVIKRDYELYGKIVKDIGYKPE